MDHDGQLRNLRDFLLVYNRMVEICFQRCSSNFNYRNLTMDEERCVDSCAGKLIRSNHRLMGTYVQLMPGIVQRRMEEMESKNAEALKAAEAAAAGEPQPVVGATPLPDTPQTVAPTTAAADMPTGMASAASGAVAAIQAMLVPITPAVVEMPASLAPAAGEQGVTTAVPTALATLPPAGVLETSQAPATIADMPTILGPSTNGALIPAVFEPVTNGPEAVIPSVPSLSSNAALPPS